MASDEYVEGYYGGGDNGRRVSRLSIKNTDSADANADGELSDEGTRYEHVSSLPGTPERLLPRKAACDKEYDSDAELQRRRSRTKGRRRWLDRAWEMRRSKEPDGECRVLVRSPGRSMRMGMEEVKARRDLGIELPSDWAVEMPYAATSSGCNSPVKS